MAVQYCTQLGGLEAIDGTHHVRELQGHGRQSAVLSYHLPPLQSTPPWAMRILSCTAHCVSVYTSVVYSTVLLIQYYTCSPSALKQSVRDHCLHRVFGRPSLPRTHHHPTIIHTQCIYSWVLLALCLQYSTMYSVIVRSV